MRFVSSLQHSASIQLTRTNRDTTCDFNPTAQLAGHQPEDGDRPLSKSLGDVTDIPPLHYVHNIIEVAKTNFKAVITKQSNAVSVHT